MPILGVIDSGKSGHLVTNSYSSIATQTVGSGGASSIIFNSIPSTYTHLQVRITAKTAGTVAGGEDIVVSLNGDTTYTNYYSHYLFGTGASAIAGGLQTGGYYGYTGQVPSSNSSQTSMFGSIVMDILDYKNTNKNKTIRDLTGFDLNGSGRIYFNSNLWLSTSTVTSLTFTAPAGSNLAQYSTFALYGIL
jgi:hypothetical protein